ESANNEAKVDVAEAEKKGIIGETERRAEAQQRIAGFNADTVKIENARALEIAESTKDLQVKRAEFDRLTCIAQLEGVKAREIREAELQREVELKRVEQEKESLRANELSKEIVKAESNIAEAKGLAESVRIKAEADLYAKQKAAEGHLAQLTAEAKGTQLKYDAEAEGMERLLAACDQNHSTVKFNMALKVRLFPELAEQNAKAIQGLNPKYNIWTRGSGDDIMNNPIANLMSSLPPLMDVFNQQTEFKLPELFGGKPCKPLK
ncbi:MAG: flotillin domain-containing protein, partial [Sylvanvirus sp.]